MRHERCNAASKVCVQSLIQGSCDLFVPLAVASWLPASKEYEIYVLHRLTCKCGNCSKSELYNIEPVW